MQLVQCGFATSTIFVFIRFWDYLAVLPAVGELTTILCADWLHQDCTICLPSDDPVCMVL